MKVFGSTDKIGSIQLHLNSTNTLCKLHFAPTHKFDLEDEVEQTGSAIIAFDDSKELDDLINVLIKFKDDCYGRIGSWKFKNI